MMRRVKCPDCERVRFSHIVSFTLQSHPFFRETFYGVSQGSDLKAFLGSRRIFLAHKFCTIMPVVSSLPDGMGACRSATEWATVESHNLTFARSNHVLDQSIDFLYHSFDRDNAQPSLCGSCGDQ